MSAISVGSRGRGCCGTYLPSIECMSAMRWGNEVASSYVDTRRDTRGLFKGGVVGARATEAQESALGTAHVPISKDASNLKDGRVLHDVALVLDGAEA